MDNFDAKEVQLIKELRKITGKRLKVEDILEWAATKLEEAEGEKVYYLPETKVYVKIEE